MKISNRKAFYKKRRTDGQEAQYSTPVELLAEAHRYFDWCIKNPCHKLEALKSGANAGNIIEIPVARPFTITGLCVFCGISEKTLAEYENDEEFRPITEHIKEIVRQNQLEGACTGIYSQTLVSRMLELTDKQDINISKELTINVISDNTKDELEKLKSNLTQP